MQPPETRASLTKLWKNPKNRDEEHNTIIQNERYNLAIDVLERLNVLQSSHETKINAVRLSKQRNKIIERLRDLDTKSMLYGNVEYVADLERDLLKEERTRYQEALQRANDDVVMFAQNILIVETDGTLRPPKSLLAVTKATRPTPRFENPGVKREQRGPNA